MTLAIIFDKTGGDLMRIYYDALKLGDLINWTFIYKKEPNEIFSKEFDQYFINPEQWDIFLGLSKKRQKRSKNFLVSCNF